MYFGNTVDKSEDSVFIMRTAANRNLEVNA